MKIIGHYPEKGEIEKDPNLQALIEHGEKLLGEDFLFDSPFNNDRGHVSDIEPDCFDLNVEDVGLQDDFDLSDSLSDFVSKIRKEDTVEMKCACLDWTSIGWIGLLALISIPIICYMWTIVLNHGADYSGSVKLYTYDYFVILFGVILTLAFMATIIVLAIHIRKKDEWEHEDRKLLFEHQNKMINEYAHHLYLIKRVKLQQSDALLSLKQQYALQQLDFQQKNMDMLKKEQDMAWKYKEEKMNAIKEYLSNWEYEMKQETKREIIEKNNNSKK